MEGTPVGAEVAEVSGPSSYLLLLKNKRATIDKSSVTVVTAACIKRIYEIDPLECPKCKAQMRIIAFIHDEHSIKDIMESQGIPDFQAPPPIPKFVDAAEAIDELPSHDSFEPSPEDF